MNEIDRVVLLGEQFALSLNKSNEVMGYIDSRHYKLQVRHAAGLFTNNGMMEFIEESRFPRNEPLSEQAISVLREHVINIDQAYDDYQRAVRAYFVELQKDHKSDEACRAKEIADYKLSCFMRLFHTDADQLRREIERREQDLKSKGTPASLKEANRSTEASILPKRVLS